MEDKQKMIDWIISMAEKSILKETGLSIKLAAKQKIADLNHKDIASIIIKTCAEEWNIDSDDIIIASRRRTVVEPRQLAIYLIRKYTLLSLEEIGMLFKTSRIGYPVKYGKDHSTIIHSIKSAENLLDYDKRYASKFNNIQNHLNNLFN